MTHKGSTIVVTGGKGFLGKALIKRLTDSGYRNVHTFCSCEYDLVNQAECQKMFFCYNPDVVVHLAARAGGIGVNKKNAGRFCYENLVMGVNVLECARTYGCEKVVVAGSICSYPKSILAPFQEGCLWNGYPEEVSAPYGLAKRMLLDMAQAYRQQYGYNFVYLLLTNLYGEHDNFDPEASGVIPAMIRKFHEAKENDKKKVVLWGDGSPTRDFLYVGDCAEAFVAALEKEYDEWGPINIGTGRETSIKDLAQLVKDTVDYNGTITWDVSKLNGQPRRCLDTYMAKECFSWEASTKLEDGIGLTYEWFREKKG